MKPVAFAFAVLFLLASSIAAASCVTISADSIGAASDEPLPVGDIVGLPLTIQTNSPAGICAVDLELTRATDAVRIRSVTFNQAFPVVLLEEPDELPASHYRTIRAQSLTTLNRHLAANGAAISLGTVELEVLADVPVGPALTITAKAATIGRSKPVTVVQVAGASSATSNTATLTLGSPMSGAQQESEMPNGLNAAGPTEGDSPESDPWTTESASLALEVQPVGGGEPLTVLAPDTTYELHYTAGYERVAWYVLFAVATSADQGFIAVTPAASGDWSSAGDFGFVDMSAQPDGPAVAPNFPAGTYRQQMASADFWPETTEYAGSQGYLCNFTTGAAGELNLELYMAWFDEAAFYSVDMQAQATYVIE